MNTDPKFMYWRSVVITTINYYENGIVLGARLKIRKLKEFILRQRNVVAEKLIQILVEQVKIYKRAFGCIYKCQ